MGRALNASENIQRIGGEKMNIQVNPKKSLQNIQVLAKDIVVKNKIAKSQVVTVFDVSGSMSGMYGSGLVTALATRVLALGLELDDNGVIPVYALNSECESVGDLTKDNLDSFVDDKLSYLVGGGTEYAPSINKVVADAQKGDPMFVLLFTDGANSDHRAAKEALIRASNLPIFFQWYGIYEDSEPDFEFLHKMDEMKGRIVDNAGFSPLGIDITDESNQYDDHDKMLFEDMVKEYKDFPQKAMMAGSNWTNLNSIHGAMKSIGGFLSKLFN